MFDPETIEAALAALEAAGYLTVTDDGSGGVRISASPKFAKLIEERGITLADIDRRAAA